MPPVAGLHYSTKVADLQNYSQLKSTQMSYPRGIRVALLNKMYTPNPEKLGRFRVIAQLIVMTTFLTADPPSARNATDSPCTEVQVCLL